MGASRRQRFLAIAAILGALGGITTIGVSNATEADGDGSSTYEPPVETTLVEPSSTPTPALSAAANGCGSQNTQVVPDGHNFGSVYVDFKPSCDRHDDCYAQGGPARDRTYLGKVACDQQFLDSMRDACAKSSGLTATQQQDCANLARLYYSAVSQFGACESYQYGPGEIERDPSPCVAGGLINNDVLRRVRDLTIELIKKWGDEKVRAVARKVMALIEAYLPANAKLDADQLKLASCIADAVTRFLTPGGDPSPLTLAKLIKCGADYAAKKLGIAELPNVINPQPVDGVGIWGGWSPNDIATLLARSSVQFTNVTDAANPYMQMQLTLPNGERLNFSTINTGAATSWGFQVVRVGDRLVLVNELAGIQLDWTIGQEGVGAGTSGAGNGEGYWKQLDGVTTAALTFDRQIVRGGDLVGGTNGVAHGTGNGVGSGICANGYRFPDGTCMFGEYHTQSTGG